MKKTLIPLTPEQLSATDKAYTLRRSYNSDEELSKEIGICRKTLYNRFQSSRWKKIEIDQINKLFDNLTKSLNHE